MAHLSIDEVIALDDPFHEEGQPMQDSARGSAGDWERASVEGSSTQ